MDFFHIRRGGGVFDQPLQRLERKVFMLIGGELGTVDNAAHDTFPNMGMTDRIGAVIILLGFGFNPFASISQLARSSCEDFLFGNKPPYTSEGHI